VVYILLLQGVCEGSAFISYKALKRILLFIRDTLKPGLKLIKDLLPIDLPSSPAIANTFLLCAGFDRHEVTKYVLYKLEKRIRRKQNIQ
jgi:hypothetical protein